MADDCFEKSEEIHPMIWIAVKIPCNQGQCAIKQQLENDIDIVLELDVHVLDDSREQ
jgi:hypothetical protein